MLKKLLLIVSIILSVQGSSATEAEGLEQIFQKIQQKIMQFPTPSEDLLSSGLGESTLSIAIDFYVVSDETIQSGIKDFGIGQCVRCPSFHLFKPTRGDELASDGRLDQHVKNKISYYLQQLYKRQDISLEDFLSSHMEAVQSATEPLAGINDQPQSFHLDNLKKMLAYQKERR